MYSMKKWVKRKLSKEKDITNITKINQKTKLSVPTIQVNGVPVTLDDSEVHKPRPRTPEDAEMDEMRRLIALTP